MWGDMSKCGENSRYVQLCTVHVYIGITKNWSTEKAGETVKTGAEDKASDNEVEEFAWVRGD